MNVKKAQFFWGNDGDLAAHLLYVPSGADAQMRFKTLDIIFPGLPQTPCFRNLEEFVTPNRAILYIHYYGTWYSGGRFTPQTTRQSVSDVLARLESGKWTDLYSGNDLSVHAEHIMLIGNSFGGHFVYQAATAHPKVLLAPLLATNPSDVSVDASSSFVTLRKQLENYAATLKNVYRGIEDASWREWVSGEAPMLPTQKGSITVYYGLEDTQITESYLRGSLALKTDAHLIPVDCGHSFYELYRAYILNS